MTTKIYDNFAKNTSICFKKFLEFVQLFYNILYFKSFLFYSKSEFLVVNEQEYCKILKMKFSIEFKLTKQNRNQMIAVLCYLVTHCRISPPSTQLRNENHCTVTNQTFDLRYDAP